MNHHPAMSNESEKQAAIDSAIPGRVKRTMIRLIAVAGLLGAALITSTTGSASATVVGGVCPLSNYVCFWQSFPRTGNNIGTNTALSNFTSWFYASGTTLNDHNKDNANFTGAQIVVCHNSNYSGGVDILLNPSQGIVVASSTGSSMTMASPTPC